MYGNKLTWVIDSMNMESIIAEGVMFNPEEFKYKLSNMAETMKNNGRGYLPGDIESKIIGELESIYLKMADRAQSSQPNIRGQRGVVILKDLIERMERDFSKRLAKDIQHDIQRDIEIGKIKIAFLDGVRRTIHAVETAK